MASACVTVHPLTKGPMSSSRSSVSFVIPCLNEQKTLPNVLSKIRKVCETDFEQVVDNELVKLVDHRNLNVDVPAFGKTNPTVENIAAFAWNELVGKFGKASLYCVTVWETDKTYCSYYG